MEKIKTGIIGCGKVTDLHAAALQKSDYSLFTAVYSRSSEKADTYARKYGVQGFSDLDAFLKGSTVDAVIVCTPHPYHAEVAVAAANAGKHVLVEKPLAATLADCDAMISAAGKNSVQLGTVCQRRFYLPSQRIHRAIKAGKLGTPVLGSVTILGWRDEVYYNSDPWRGRWRQEGGGVLVNQAPHQLDLLQWYMGPIQEVTGYRANLNHPYIEVEDTAVAIVRFQSGGLATIRVSNAQNPALYGKVHIHGSNGASVGVQTDGGAMFIAGMSGITEPPQLDFWTVPGEEQRLEEYNREDIEFFQSVNAMEYFHQCQIDDFLGALLKGTRPLVTGEEGRKTVELFTAIYRSERDHSPIVFPLKAESDRLDMDGRLG